MVMMQSAIVDLLATASETLRRIRGARSIQKAHTGLENQLRAMTLGRAREWKAETNEVKQETREEVEEGTREEKDPDQELRRIQKAATLVHEGHVRKAVHGLFTGGVPSLTEDTMRSLREHLRSASSCHSSLSCLSRSLWSGLKSLLLVNFGGFGLTP